MKKIIAGIFAFALIGTFIPYSEINNSNIIFAEEVQSLTYDVFTYETKTLSDEEYITITLCDHEASGIIDIPNEIDGIPVKSIELKTFTNCLDITVINIPENITDLKIIISEKSKLEAINVDENNSSYCSENGILFSKDKTELVKYPPMYQGESYIIPDTVTNIADTAFCGNLFLKSVKTSSNLEKIGFASFALCSSLEEIDIEYGLRIIAGTAFYKCTSLKEVTIPGTVDMIYAGAFSECSGLEKVVLEEGVRCIFSGSFLSTNGAFSNCKNLSDITFPENSLAYIGRNTFDNTAWYENQPDGMIYINDIAYKYKGTYTGTPEFKIKDGVKSISGGAFENVSGIESIITPESLYELIGEEFIYCNDLNSITILNPDCRIDFILVDDNTFPDIDYSSIYHGIIKGYSNSTAEAFALENENEFISLDSTKSTLKGDANLDGKVDIADAVSVAAYIGDSENNILDSQGIINGDVQGDGNGLNSSDVLAIQQYLAGIITNF